MLAALAHYVRRHHIGFLALFIALGGTSFAAVRASTPATIHACAGKRAGSLRVVAARNRCHSDERSLSWAQRGRTGAAGEDGLDGADGLDGLDGLDGAGAGAEGWQRVGDVGEPGFGAPDWTAIPGGAVPTPGFRSELGDVVRLSGQALQAGGGNWNSATQPIFTLPAGYRPPAAVRIPVAGAPTVEPGQLYIEPDGDVFARGPGSGYVILDGVTFTTD
jgi:hypothetical protein